MSIDQLLAESRKVGPTATLAPYAVQTAPMCIVEDIAVFIIDPAETEKQWAASTLYSIAMGRMLSEKLSNGEKLGSYISLLITASQGHHSPLSEILMSMGFRPIIVKVKADASKIESRRGYAADEFVAAVNRVNIPWTADSVASIGGLYTTLIGREPEVIGRGQWWGDSVREYVTRFAADEKMLRTCQVPLAVAYYIYQKVSGSLQLRRYLFNAINDYTRAQNGTIAEGLKMGTATFRCTGMIHIAVIRKFLMAPVHLALLMPRIRPELRALTSIYSKLATMTSEQANYTKIIFEDAENEVFNQNKILYTTAVAMYVAMISDSTYMQYDQTVSNQLDATDKADIEALDMLMNRPAMEKAGAVCKEHGDDIVSQAVGLLKEKMQTRYLR